MSRKEKFALYLPPDLRAEVEEHCQKEGGHSLTAFIERAVRFYLGYLDAQDAGIFLPAAIRSCIDGRLGTLENRMASLLFKQAVELDMCERILADSYRLDEAYLRRKRAESVESVKRTNGRLRFEQIARQYDEDEDNNEWLD